MDFKEYLKQLSIVIVGILIAFWISNSGMNYKDRATQKQVLLTILNELKDNNENVKATMRNLDTLRMTFTGVQNLNTLSDTADVSVTVKYIGLRLKSIGYETAKYTGILKDVNYKLVSKIVDNYESQKTQEELEKLMTDELFELLKNQTDDGNNTDYLLRLILNVIDNLERFDPKQNQLIEDLKVFLEMKS